MEHATMANTAVTFTGVCLHALQGLEKQKLVCWMKILIYLILFYHVFF